ncbi:hypothetical protein FH972_019956 [Carpinus fangiana]|uniref:Uncharacterized protein n=1 Tax=Carpinus fangiana TaxID=176857 RepID=A0A5N6RUX9_9ROSI|nr:hypothetical protein FH972_019956 [Carpinus fangiana]
MEASVEHPYVPRDLKLLGFVPCSLSQSAILLIYGVSSLLVVSLVWPLSGLLLVTTLLAHPSPSSIHF